MGKEEIIKRILSDAEAEAEGIIAAAEENAEGIIAAATAKAKKERAETEEECSARAKLISDGKAAEARLDSAKILLAEKRRVIDVIYQRALQKLIALNERDCLRLLETLLSDNAEEGDEIVLAENFAYEKGAKALPVVKEKKLVFSAERAKISGGCILHGKLSDKDLSYAALLNADKDEYQAEIAIKLFKNQT